VPQQPLKPVDVAALFAVSEETVKNWADTGKLAGFKTPSGGGGVGRAARKPLLDVLNANSSAPSPDRDDGTEEPTEENRNAKRGETVGRTVTRMWTQRTGLGASS
jgi:hypothetical protein